MKEATGEANMTIVTVIIIAAVVAIATPIITNLMGSLQGKTDCINNGGIWADNTCDMSHAGTVS